MITGKRYDHTADQLKDMTTRELILIWLDLFIHHYSIDLTGFDPRMTCNWLFALADRYFADKELLRDCVEEIVRNY